MAESTKTKLPSPVVQRKILYVILSLLVFCMSFQFLMLNILGQKHSVEGNDVYYFTEDPELSTPDQSLTLLLKDLVIYKQLSINSTLIRTFLFSFYPPPNINLTSSFTMSKELFNSLQNELEKLKYFTTYTRNICNKTVLVGGWSYKKRVDGAKQVCVDYLPPRHGKSCLVYSFGVGNDFSFEKEMAAFGCQVFAFDDDELHNFANNYSSNVYFFKIRLGKTVTVLREVKKTENKEYIYLYRPLDNIMYILHHSTLAIDILKIDIEGHEWEVLNESLCKNGILKRTKQLIIEIHLSVFENFTNIDERHFLTNTSYYNKAFQCLRDHHFEHVFSVPNEIRLYFSVISGHVFHICEEQLWINTQSHNSETFPDKYEIVPKNVDKTGRIMEYRRSHRSQLH